MLKQKTINIIINAVKPFKVILDFLSCETKDRQAYFKFKICNKINATKMFAYVDDIRMRLACRDKVKIESVSDDIVIIILSDEFAEDENIVQEDIELNAGNAHVDDAIKDIKQDLKDGKTVDTKTLI